MKSTLQKAFDAADSEVQAFYGQKWLQESEYQSPTTQHILSMLINVLSFIAIYHPNFYHKNMKGNKFKKIHVVQMSNKKTTASGSANWIMK